MGIHGPFFLILSKAYLKELLSAVGSGLSAGFAVLRFLSDSGDGVRLPDLERAEQVMGLLGMASKCPAIAGSSANASLTRLVKFMT